jgi:thiamine biosynthesis lipoprotein
VSTSTLTEHRLAFRAMGTEVLALVATGVDASTAIGALEAVRVEFTAQEARFSRFIADSELCRLNRAGGTDAPSAELWEVLTRAREWWAWSGGLFDPTVLGALEAAGYDRTFSDLPATVSPGAPSHPVADFGDVRLSESGGARSVVLPPGVRLDLGGLVKGWTADRAGRLLAGFDGFLVDAGGDVAAGGVSADGDGWCVALVDPAFPGVDRWGVWLQGGAVATSGTYRRHWALANGGSAHHLIDPRTGAPSTSALAAVTVTASSAEAAEVAAKTALLAGGAGALDVLARLPGAEGLAYEQDGAFRASGGWRMLPLGMQVEVVPA